MSPNPPNLEPVMTVADAYKMLRDHVEAGFEAINDRLDRLNGQTAKNTESSILHGERIEELRRRTSAMEVVRLAPLDLTAQDRRNNRADAPAVGEDRAWTKRDTTMIGTGVGAALGLIKAWPYLQGLFKP